MKHLLSLLLFASPVLAEPVCEKWGYQYAIGGGSVACTKWHETPTPVVTPNVYQLAEQQIRACLSLGGGVDCSSKAVLDRLNRSW